MINKDSFYGLMTNRYEVNLFCFLCNSAELDTKHNVAGFRLLSILCVTLTWTFSGKFKLLHTSALSVWVTSKCVLTF